MKNVLSYKQIVIISLISFCTFIKIKAISLEEKKDEIQNESTPKNNVYKAGVAISLASVSFSRNWDSCRKDFRNNDRYLDTDIQNQKKSIDIQDLKISPGITFGLFAFCLYKPLEQIGIFFEIGWLLSSFSMDDIADIKYYSYTTKTNPTNGETEEKYKLIENKTKTFFYKYEFINNDIQTRLMGRWYPIWIKGLYITVGAAYALKFITSLQKTKKDALEKHPDKSYKEMDKDSIAKFEINACLGLGFELANIWLEIFWKTGCLDKFEFSNLKTSCQSFKANYYGLNLGYDILSLL